MSKIFNIVRSVTDFTDWWENESEATSKMLGALTDASLSQPVATDHRTLGRMAWHLVGSIPEMCNRVGLQIDGPKENDPVPKSAAAIKAAYDKVRVQLSDQIKKKWTDETLKQVDDMYGFQWTRSFTIAILVHHEIHHRGQMTVLMRQAGLKVPGIYGPSYEEWVNYGGNPPEV